MNLESIYYSLGIVFFSTNLLILLVIAIGFIVVVMKLRRLKHQAQKILPVMVLLKLTRLVTRHIFSGKKK